MPKRSTQATTLRLGDSVDRELPGATTHSYRLELSADQFFRIKVEQLGADVALSIKAPDGTKSPEIDRPNGTRGQEWMSWIARASGPYVLQEGRGRYRLRVELSIRLPQTTYCGLRPNSSIRE